MSQQATYGDDYNWADVSDDSQPPVLVRTDRIIGTLAEWERDNGNGSGASFPEDKEPRCEDCGRELVCNHCSVVSSTSHD